MSKESNTNPKQAGGKKFPPTGMPNGIRDLAAAVFNDTPALSPQTIVSKSDEDTNGIIVPENNSDNGLIDFRNFLEDYRNGDVERVAIYITPDVKDVLYRLKTARDLKKYSLKDIVNSIIHAYVLEHRAEINQILSQTKNNILD